MLHVIARLLWHFIEKSSLELKYFFTVMYLEYDMYNNGCFDVLFSTSNVLHPILILRS